MSYTQSEFRALIKGAQHREIQEYDRLTDQAFAIASLTNAKKRVRKKQMFDAEKAHRRLDGENIEEMERVTRLNDTFKGFKPDFRPKGG